MLNRSLEADVLRTSECGNAASKRPPSRSPLHPLVDDGAWLTAIDDFRTRNPRRLPRIAAYEALVADGAHLRVAAAVLDGQYQPAPPRETWLNKVDGRKKRVFQYEPVDELLFKVVNRLLQPLASEAASPWCRSFLPGGGARAAFRAVVTDPDLESKAALRLDVRDYFNSIDVIDLMMRLPDGLTSGPVGTLLEHALLDPRVIRGGLVVDDPRKGVMAGTPLAPLLATLYLSDLDHEVASWGATYSRYSDDVLVLAPPDDLHALESLIRTRLGERGLEVNEAKSAVASVGEPWEFLGFRHHRGRISLATITEHKLKARSTRLARSLLRWREQTHSSSDRTLRAFFRKTNRRLYGVPSERADFSWATWFLPMLDGPDGLAALDHHVQREARYAATGRRNPRTRREIAYASLTEAGHRPLVSAFWELRNVRRSQPRHERAQFEPHRRGH